MPDLTLQELATLTQRHVETLRRLARQGRIPGVYKIGQTWRISREAVDRMRQVQVSGVER